MYFSGAIIPLSCTHYKNFRRFFYSDLCYGKPMTVQVQLGCKLKIVGYKFLKAFHCHFMADFDLNDQSSNEISVVLFDHFHEMQHDQEL